MNLSWHNTDQVRLSSRLTNFYRSYCPLLNISFPSFSVSMVPTDHGIPFSRTFKVNFQGLFFVLSNINSLKNGLLMDFSNKTYRDHLILSSPDKWCGGGIWVPGYVFLTFLHDLLYYGYNTGSNDSAFFFRISTKSCNSRQFWRVH